MITNIVHKPLAITNNLYRLGIPAFPVYLSLGTDAMIIEGGIGAVYPLVVDQISELGVQPDRIKYVALTHSHADHIGAVPYLKKLWPHLKIIAGQNAALALDNEPVIKTSIEMNNVLTKILLSKREITEPPPDIEDHKFKIDRIVKENDIINLGGGISWRAIETPGHSSCHTSYFEEKEKILSIGDATGFYSPGKDLFWPNYFESLELYCRSIRKLQAQPAVKGMLSHNYIVESEVKGFLENALNATRDYHLKLLDQVSGGDHYNFVTENAKWVNTLTDDHPYEIMVSLSRLLVKRSLAENGNKNLFE